MTACLFAPTLQTVVNRVKTSGRDGPRARYQSRRVALWRNHLWPTGSDVPIVFGVGSEFRPKLRTALTVRIFMHASLGLPLFAIQ